MEKTDKKKKVTDAKKKRGVSLETPDTVVKAQVAPTPVEVAAPVTFKINGKLVEAQPGMTVLEAAQSAGIFIPTLCHHKELSVYGACRLCMVELKARRRSRIVASCLYPVENDIEVLTESERIVKHRRVVLELIQARWPWVDKDLLERYGVKQGRFEEHTNFCILCGLCVRYCTEVKKANVLGYIGRGVERQVVIYAEQALKVCPTCDGGVMGCRSVCPTGVIPNDFTFTGPRFGKKVPLAYPVRIYDGDNVRAVLHTVGDWRMPWVQKSRTSSSLVEEE
jgi:bidirectional [NiFe] hydrogenase diaphorase subunit